MKVIGKVKYKEWSEGETLELKIQLPAGEYPQLQERLKNISKGKVTFEVIARDPL